MREVSLESPLFRGHGSDSSNRSFEAFCEVGTIENRRSDWKQLAVYGALAMEMALSVAAGTVVGYLLDGFFQTAPILTLVFLLLGVVGGIVNFVKLWELLKKKT